MREEIIDSRQLLAFRTLAHTGSFTLAAKQLNLTQSAVSHSIKALEDDLNCSLISRLGRKIHLTQAGENFLSAAERMIRQMQHVRTELDSLGKWGAGRLRIGAGTTACQYVLPSLIREFRQTFPDCQLSVVPGDAKELLELLRSNEIDMALTLIPPGQDDIQHQIVFEDALQFVVSPMHPWASRKNAPLNEIEQQSYVTYSKKSYTFELVRKHFRSEGHDLSNVIELGSMEAIKELVKIGIGVGIVAPWIVQKESEEESLFVVGLGQKKVKRSWAVCHLKGRKPTLMEETFIGLCESVFDGVKG
ncbi:LysR family transcriptional regulator [Puniceicoccaceae bacterium K14]|nr:LysR family transcriptional regulator [Puniceicoccaceae bacterium K14]